MMYKRRASVSQFPKLVIKVLLLQHLSFHILSLPMCSLGIRVFCFCILTVPVLAQETLTGRFSGMDTTSCDNGTTFTGTFSGTVTAVVQPPLSSLAASGGSF